MIRNDLKSQDMKFPFVPSYPNLIGSNSYGFQLKSQLKMLVNYENFVEQNCILRA